jgi:hypothetical protein
MIHLVQVIKIVNLYNKMMLRKKIANIKINKPININLKFWQIILKWVGKIKIFIKICLKKIVIWKQLNVWLKETIKIKLQVINRSLKMMIIKINKKVI